MKAIARALALALVFTAAASPARAQSQTSEEVSYPFERVWPAAVRFIRVDAGHPIEEKDADSGYILFVYKHEGREFRGALEVVRIRDEHDRDAVRLVVRIDARPSYLERALLNRLVRKLRDELGPPPPPPPPPSDDDDDDKDEEDEEESAASSSRGPKPGLAANS